MKAKGQVPFKASTELLYKSLIYLVYDYIKSNDDWHYILCFHSWCWCALCVDAWNCLIFSSKDLSYRYIPLWYWQDNDLYHLCLPKEMICSEEQIVSLGFQRWICIFRTEFLFNNLTMFLHTIWNMYYH